MTFLLPNILEKSQNLVPKIFCPILKIEKPIIFFCLLHKKVKKTKFPQISPKFRQNWEFRQDLLNFARAFKISPFFAFWRKFRQSGNAGDQLKLKVKNAKMRP